MISAGDFAFLADSQPSSPGRFDKTFADPLDTSKTFDRVWHRALPSKVPPMDSSPLSVLSSLFSFLTILSQLL